MITVDVTSFARFACVLWLACFAGPGQAAPHDTIIQLTERVDTLTAQQVLTPGQGRSLGVKLEHAARDLRFGEASSAIHRLEVFEQESAALSVAIPQKDALFMSFQSQLARQEISQLAFGLPGHLAGTFQPCFSDAGCDYTVLYVDAAARNAADGSESNPFSTIGAALAHAFKLNACGIELRLAAGTYAETVQAPLHLKLRGQGRGVVINGSIVNPDGWALDISRLQIRAAAMPGAIVTDSFCPSDTEISRVGITNATGFGVFQRGGRLRMNLSTIADTRARPGSPSSGTGILLTGGVQAILGLVDVERSQSSGLVAEGPATRVYIAASRFANGDAAAPDVVPESSPPPAAGVEIRQGALALMQFTNLVGNELYGLSVRDGARAHFRYGTIENTLSLPRSHPFSSLADANLLGLQASAIELTSFTLQNSIVGMILNQSPASAAIGSLRNHEIGMFMNPDPPTPEAINDAFFCATDRVAFFNNRRNVDGPFLPVPGDGDGDPPICVQVPFVCDWCEP